MCIKTWTQHQCTSLLTLNGLNLKAFDSDKCITLDGFSTLKAIFFFNVISTGLVLGFYEDCRVIRSRETPKSSVAYLDERLTEISKYEQGILINSQWADRTTL